MREFLHDFKEGFAAFLPDSWGHTLGALIACLGMVLAAILAAWLLGMGFISACMFLAGH